VCCEIASRFAIALLLKPALMPDRMSTSRGVSSGRAFARHADDEPGCNSSHGRIALLRARIGRQRSGLIEVRHAECDRRTVGYLDIALDNHDVRGFGSIDEFVSRCDHRLLQVRPPLRVRCENRDAQCGSSMQLRE
jgi:hypothetical protein